jgi:hypothetical protein
VVDIIKIRVKVTGAPAFEDFEGWTMPEVHNFAHVDGDLRTAVLTDNGEIFVFKSQYVTDCE